MIYGMNTLLTSWDIQGSTNQTPISDLTAEAIRSAQ
jgi:hypothetical protein